MASTSTSMRDAGPFLIKLYYRTGAFHRLDEFNAPQRLAFVSVHALPSCSLAELAHHLAAAQGPAVLPSPCIGTRIVFRHIYANSRYRDDGNSSGNGLKNLSSDTRFITKDLGSVVLGGNGPGAPTTSLDTVDDYIVPEELLGDEPDDHGEMDDGEKTLADFRYVAGEFISCAILPPLANGCVTPASSARSGRGSGIGEATTSNRPPSPPRTGASRLIDSRYGRGGRNGRGPVVPTGEWRRGDALPDGGAWVRDGGRGGDGMGRRDRGWRRDGRNDRDDCW